MNKKYHDLKDRFTDLFKNKRLLAIQLNGFTHKVFFDNGKKTDKIESLMFSAYLSTCEYNEADRIQLENLKKLFKGFANYQYQNKATELVWIDPRQR
jgi:hypothetical protein